MRAYVQQYYQRIVASYWFVPSIMAVVAALLAFLLIEIDARVPLDAFGESPFFYATQPDGARAILSAIGGSMIGVAGTVFSVTMAAVVFASGNYGPRLLTNFMNDRGNQITLGVFVATFVYCMLVLRSVRDGGEGGDNDFYAVMFVPNIAIFGAILLAIGSIGVLIFFIHHVPSNIHISNVVAGIGTGLCRQLDDTFPDPDSEATDREATGPDEPDHLLWQVPACFGDEVDETSPTVPYAEVVADRSGYLQIIDRETLIKAARAADIVVRMNCRTGIFVHPGRVLFHAWPSERVTDEVRAALVSSIACGNQRSPHQDPVFLVDELVEIAGRALSPGVNDPYTAITCMDWLTSAMARLAGREPADPLLVDADGRLRVIALPDSFAEYLEFSFGHLRQYAATDMIAAEHYLECLEQIAPATRRPGDIAALRRQHDAFMGLARRGLAGAALEVVEARAERLVATLDHPVHRVPYPVPAGERVERLVAARQPAGTTA
ncbi:DUF2254 domain-containing protein [Aurantimonas sp. A2-1-M11]|uniref:DUF2254 domain-containing protein n=1 Tax=Aurantimonas sp. A2-1-M11 TaxID=3113712 RepID=UPI002F95165F